MQETHVQSLGREDPLEKGVATHSSLLAWRIPWTEEPGGLQSMGSQRVGYDWMTDAVTSLSHVNTELIHSAVQQKIAQHCKVTIHQLQQFFLFRKGNVLLQLRVSRY